MAPSKILTATARNLAQMGAVRRQLVAQAQAESTLKTLSVRGPFTGYAPDIDPNLLDGTALNRMRNCLAHSQGQDHGEVLGLPDGYRQVDPTRLPLGDGSTLPGAAANADPVVRVDQVSRYAPTAHATPGEFTGEFVLTPMAVTAGDGTTNESGNMYRIAATGQWTHVPKGASVTAARALKAGRDGRTSSPCMPDSCVAPFGATARARNTAGADDLQSGAIDEPCWIFTNDVDEVMVFPSNSGNVDGTLAAPAVHAYEPLCDPTSSPTLDGGAAAGFKAKSVETWNGRVYFLNTEEAGTRHSQRLRRTARFTADPDPVLVGAGSADFREFQGEGLRIETLGDVLSVYFSDGVAFLRPTGVPTSPDEPQIISTERGLLGTHAMTPMGRNVHFGIFTDGWWLIDQSGRWEQVGVVNLDGKVVPKWRQTFYDDLPANQRHRLYCYYDQPTNLVYILRPTSTNPEPAEVWIYDPTSDRVFFENYSATCFGSYTPLSQAGVLIDALVGTIDSLTGTIDSYGSVAGFPKVRVHGDQTGFVYQHRRDLVGFDSAVNPPTVQDPSWSFGTGLRAVAGTRNLTTVDRVSIEYFNHQNNANVSVEVDGPDVDGSQTGSTLLNQGNADDVQVADTWFRYTSRDIGLEVSGTGDYHVRALEVDVWVDEIEPRGAS